VRQQYDVYRAYGLFRGLETGTPDPQPFDEEALGMCEDGVITRIRIEEAN
jgi:hypothetical protein